MELSAYRDALDLDRPFVATAPAATDEARVIERLLATVGDAGPDYRHLPDRVRLTARLTVRPPDPLPTSAWADLDALWLAERARVATVAVCDLPALASDQRLALWRGDITTLASDAIVNAANNQLLGCFQPFHRCIDNAIHSAAGPRLRDACGRLMARQGHPEATGTAKLTRAYHLPSRFVLHTVGPIIGAGRPTADDQRLLARCYRSCLDLAASHGDITTVAFCCISTGVFGYPPDAAARVAVTAVSGWLDAHPGALERVVFNVFTANDEALYRNLLGGDQP